MIIAVIALSVLVVVLWVRLLVAVFRWGRAVGAQDERTATFFTEDSRGEAVCDAAELAEDDDGFLYGTGIEWAS